MAKRKKPGSSAKRPKGVLFVQKPYLRIPYCLLRSDDFLALNPLAVKLYLLLLRQWKTNEPDEPVRLSYVKMREHTGAGYSRISTSLKQLMVFGFLEIEKQYKACNEYYIEQKRFTGEYR